MEFVNIIFGDMIDLFKEMVFSINRFMIGIIISFVFFIIYSISYSLFGMLSLYDKVKERLN